MPNDLPMICAYCQDFSINVKEPNKGPYCRLWDKVFPEPTAWVSNPEIRKPGERSCMKWRARRGAEA